MAPTFIAALALAMGVALLLVPRPSRAGGVTNIEWLNWGQTATGTKIPALGHIPSVEDYDVPGIGRVHVVLTGLPVGTDSCFYAGEPWWRKSAPLQGTAALTLAGQTYTWDDCPMLDVNFANPRCLADSIHWQVTFTFDKALPSNTVYVGASGLGWDSRGYSIVSVNKPGTFIGDYENPLYVAGNPLGNTTFTPGASFTMRNSEFTGSDSNPGWNSKLGVAQINVDVSTVTYDVWTVRGDGMSVAIGFDPPSCHRPPDGLVAWWPLDENAGSTTFDVVGSAHDSIIPGPGSAMPTFDPNGFSAGDFEFGTTKSYVSAGTQVGNFSNDFSVDAWVRIDGTLTCPAIVVDKETGVYPSMTGYRLYVTSTNGAACEVGLGGSGPTASIVDPLSLADGQWHLLMLRARRWADVKIPYGYKSGYNVSLYRDGWLVDSKNVIRQAGGGPFYVSNTGDFRIGQYCANHSPCSSGLSIDEVELFDQFVRDGAGFGLASKPKCKCRAELCSVVQCAPGSEVHSVKLRLWNNGFTSTHIPWSIRGVSSAQSGCSRDGSSMTFTPSGAFPGPLVPAGGHLDVTITANCPTVTLASDQECAGFRVTTLNCFGDSTFVYGRVVGPTVINGVTQCVVDPPPCFQDLTFGTTAGNKGSTLSYAIRNLSNAGADVSWFVREAPPVADSIAPVMRLNGLPPGTPILPSVVHVPANGSVNVSVAVVFAGPAATTATHLEFLMGAVGDTLPAVSSDLSLATEAPCNGTYDGWIHVDPDSTPPSARSEGTMVFDAVNNRLVEFGGYDGAYRNDVWVTDVGPAPVWRQLAPAGTPPPGLSDHTAIYDPVRQRMLVFGGSDGSAYHNDVWSLSLVAGSESWTHLAPLGTPPAVRRSHSAIYEPAGDRMIVFGGYAPGYRNDVTALSLAGTPAWSTLTPAGTAPAARQGHSAVYDPQGQRMIVFGGEDGANYLNDVWSLSFSGSPTWSPLAPTGTPPSARRYQCASLDSTTRTLVLFGGEGAGGYTGDAWSLALSGTPAWTEATPVAMIGPSARDGAMSPARTVDGRMLVYGGLDSTGRNGELWALQGGHPCTAPSAYLAVPPGYSGGSVRLLAAPNPFHASTVLTFDVPVRQGVSVRIYDVAGRVVRSIDAGNRGPGPVDVSWDGLGDDRRPARPGAYWARVRVGTRQLTGAVVRLQ